MNCYVHKQTDRSLKQEIACRPCSDRFCARKFPKQKSANAYETIICRLSKIIICAEIRFLTLECHIRLLNKKEESLDLQDFLDGSGDRIRTNDTLGMKWPLAASGRLITQQKT